MNATHLTCIGHFYVHFSFITKTAQYEHKNHCSQLTIKNLAIDLYGLQIDRNRLSVDAEKLIVMKLVARLLFWICFCSFCCRIFIYFFLTLSHFTGKKYNIVPYNRLFMGEAH